MNCKLYNLTWGQCTENIKAELKSIENYTTWSNNQSSVDFTKNIKGVTFKFIDNYYPLPSIQRGLKALFTSIQKEDIILEEYLDKFKNNLKILENYRVNINQNLHIFDKEYKNLDALNKEEQKKINKYKNKMKDSFLEHVILALSNSRKCSTLKELLDNEYLTGDDNYPETIGEVFNVLLYCEKFEKKQNNINRNNNEKNNRIGILFMQITEHNDNQTKLTFCDNCIKYSYIKPQFNKELNEEKIRKNDKKRHVNVQTNYNKKDNNSRNNDNKKNKNKKNKKGKFLGVYISITLECDKNVRNFSLEESDSSDEKQSPVKHKRMHSNKKVIRMKEMQKLIARKNSSKEE